jgi:hypothetical protein
VVLTADRLGQAYETQLAGRRLVISMPLFEPGSGLLAEPALIYRRPDSYVNVDPEDAWGELRSWDTDGAGTVIPRTVNVKRVRLVSCDSVSFTYCSLLGWS